MATDVEALMLRIEANATKFERDFARAVGVVDRSSRAIERRAQGMSQRLEGIFATAGRTAVGALSGALSALSGREFLRAADSFTRIQNNLRVAGLSGEALAATMEQLFRIAQDNAVPLEGLSELYGRVAQAQTTLGASSQELVGFTAIVAQALRVSGKSAAEASGALLQLGQSLSGGKIQAEEYNSLIDGLYPLLQAAAAGLKEAGGDVAKLTALVKDGKVSSQAFFRAIEAGAPVLQQKLAGATATGEQGIVRLNNSLTQAAGILDKATGASAAFGAFLDNIGVRAVGAAKDIALLVDAIGRIPGVSGYQDRVTGQARDAVQSSPFLQDLLRRAPQPPALQRALGVEPPPQAARSSDASAVSSGRPQQPVRPVSLTDFKPPPGSGGSKSATESAYARETKAVQEKIAALKVEAETVGQTTAAQERAKIVLDLTTAAQEANAKAGLGANVVTAAQKAQIETLATSYATAKQRVEDLEKAQRDLTATMDAIRSTAGSTLGTFLNDMAEGTKLSEALKTAVDSIRTALLNAFANQLIAALFGPTGTAGGGFFASLFGRAGGGPVSAGRPYVVGESGREVFVPRTAGRVVPMSRAGGGGNSFTTVIDARGADPSVLPRIERQMREHEARLTALQRAPEAQRRGGAR